MEDTSKARLNLLFRIANKIDRAIENDTRSAFQTGIDCFSEMFGFLCEYKLDLWSSGKASPMDLASIRSVYLLVLRENPISRWPDYLYIFHLAYPAALSLWISWLQEEIRTNPDREQILFIFLQNQIPGKDQANTLLQKRNEFLARTLEQLVYDMEIPMNSPASPGTFCSGACCQSPMPCCTQQKYIEVVYPDARCDPPTSSVIDKSVITCLVNFAQCFRSYDPTNLLRYGGPVYNVLDEFNNYLRLNSNKEILCTIQQTERELIDVCMRYLKSWEANLLLEAQLLEVGSLNSPARHFYRACFAVNARRPATIQSSGVQALYLYAEITDYAVTFFFKLPTATRWQSITLVWAEVPYYQDKIVFADYNVNPKAPLVLERAAPLPLD